MTENRCYKWEEASNHVVINGVCSNYFADLKEVNGNYADYIQLYNLASVPVFLSGFSLLDSETELQE